MQSATAEARELDRQLNAARDPAEMRRLITRRRLVRAGMDFDAAVKRLELELPVSPIREAFPFRLG